MSDERPEEWIIATEDSKPLPVKELLTGRGFVSGKSGSGKSNTVSVICEELLEAHYTLLIIDTEGEYFGLKEEYQLLHVGGDDFAEVQVGPQHADKIAELALEKNVPVILDVSGYDDTETSEELITRVVDELYTREKRVRKPFLLVVEEMQEYLPQQGSTGDLGELLERVAKRGRKRGLGMCGVSQRPSSVDKDYITQCDWMVWHKFTWESDLNVVSNVIGSDRAAECEDFDPGEGYMMTDWDDTTERVQFRRKRTFDAGATPGLESFDRPNLKQVGEQFISEIQSEGPAGGASSVDSVEGGTSPMEANGADPFEDLDAEQAMAEATATTEESGDATSTTDESAETVGDGSEDGEQPANAESTDEDETTASQSSLALDREKLAELDDEELAERVEQIREENQTLKAEVEELREDKTTGSVSGTPPHSAQLSPSHRRYGPNRDDSGQSPDFDPPSRPTPPARQDVDNGAARALFEFGDLMMYLWKLFVFYNRYWIYKVRVWAWRQATRTDTDQ